MSDLVGDLGKQKKIGKITGKTPEAKGTNYVIGCYKRIAQEKLLILVNVLCQPIVIFFLRHPMVDIICYSIAMVD